MKTFVLVGAGGQLGTAWVRWLEAQEEMRAICIGRSAPPVGEYRSWPGSIEELASWRPYAIVHLAGPYRIIEDPERVHASAVALAESLVSAARQARAKLVLISCDRVFDGAVGPFDEAAVPTPVSETGKALRAVEETVENGCDDRLIIRTSGLYGWAPHRPESLPDRWVRHWDGGGTVTASGEYWMSPTPIEHLPRVVHTLLRRDGLFHVAGSQRMTSYDLARAVARVWEIGPERVRASDTNAFPGGLVSERYQRFSSRLPDVESCLQEVRRKLAGSQLASPP